MKDWLRADRARVPRSARGAAERWATSDTAIKLTGSVANTHKHLRRWLPHQPHKVVAGVSGVSVGDAGASIAISWLDPQTRLIAGTRDALELAKVAVDRWRTFFAKHNLDAPY